MEEIFGELERFGSEFIYPNRWIILPILIVLIVGALAAAWRLRLYQPLVDHKYITAGIGIPLLAIAIPVGWYLLSPLWERSFLEEAAPEFDRSAVATTVPDEESTPPPATAARATAASDAGASATEPPATTAADASGDATASAAEADEGGAQLYAFGEWQGSDDFHFAEGKAFIIETEPGVYILRVEEFSVRNGPDLFVYLSRNPDGWEEEAINLGDLKATDGAFNYEIPSDIDIEEFKSAVVWCRRFAVLFGHATLEIVTE
ncbi:MAG: DM13 domain-containing protein [Dehalococcoidia bacterium]|nr:DM13 domain-containing protein [Dehalococcoidia bacterium]MYA52219.1 DM13 domain-containing protein [Dehalococcoidia bacterium]